MGGKQSSSILPISSSTIISVESREKKHYQLDSKKQSSTNSTPQSSSKHHQHHHKKHNHSKKSKDSKTNSPTTNPHDVIDSFNSIPTHLSSSSRSEDVYCDSSNCSTTMEHDFDVQSCNSSNSSVTSSLDESCVSSSICTTEVNSISDTNCKYRPSHQFHSTHYRHSQYKRAHEANQSYPVILPSHENTKKQAFENNTSSFPHKSSDNHAQLRRIQSERTEPMLNTHENTIQSAHFPESLNNLASTPTSNNNSLFNTTPRFKCFSSNKVHCILQLNSERELERNTIEYTASEIRKPQTPNKSPSHKEPQIYQFDEKIRMNSSSKSLCPPSEGGAFASYVR